MQYSAVQYCTLFSLNSVFASLDLEKGAEGLEDERNQHIVLEVLLQGFDNKGSRRSSRGIMNNVTQCLIKRPLILWEPSRLGNHLTIRREGSGARCGLGFPPDPVLHCTALHCTALQAPQSCATGDRCN